MAAAYQKIGDVQGYAVRPNLGQFAAALQSHRTALEIVDRLAARGYDPKVQRLLALAHHRVGFLSQGSLAVDRNATPEHYRRSIELLDRLRRESPGDVETLRLLVMVYGHQGDSEITLGHLAEAAAHWELALEAAQRWSERDPGDAAVLALGNAYRRVGKAWQLRGDLQKALDTAQTAIVLHDRLAAKQPNSTAMQREVLNSYERLALTYGDMEYLSLEDLPSAFQTNRKVVDIAKALFDADRNNKMAASDLAVAKRNHCMFAPESDPAGRLKVCQESIDFAEVYGREILDVQPVAALRMAPTLAKLGRRNEAVKMAERSLEVLKAAIENFPWNIAFRLQLLRIHNLLGVLRLETGDAAGALNQFHSALAIAQDAASGRADDIVLLRDTADCYRNLGAYFAKQNLAKAREWFQKELDVWTEWPRHTVSTAIDQNRRTEAAQDLSRLQPHP